MYRDILKKSYKWVKQLWSTTVIVWILNKVCQQHGSLSFIHSNLNARYATRVSTIRNNPSGNGETPRAKVCINWYSHQDGSNQGKFKIYFPICIFHPQCLFIASNSGMFFPVRTNTGALIILWSNLTLKASNSRTVTISVQLEFIMLTACKSHKCCIVY